MPVHDVLPAISEEIMICDPCSENLIALVRKLCSTCSNCVLSPKMKRESCSGPKDSKGSEMENENKT